MKIRGTGTPSSNEGGQPPQKQEGGFLGRAWSRLKSLASSIPFGPPSLPPDQPSLYSYYKEKNSDSVREVPSDEVLTPEQKTAVGRQLGVPAKDEQPEDSEDSIDDSSTDSSMSAGPSASSASSAVSPAPSPFAPPPPPPPPGFGDSSPLNFAELESQLRELERSTEIQLAGPRAQYESAVGKPQKLARLLDGVQKLNAEDIQSMERAQETRSKAAKAIQVAQATIKSLEPQLAILEGYADTPRDQLPERVSITTAQGMLIEVPVDALIKGVSQLKEELGSARTALSEQTKIRDKSEQEFQRLSSKAVSLPKKWTDNAIEEFRSPEGMALGELPQYVKDGQVEITRLQAQVDAAKTRQRQVLAGFNMSVDALKSRCQEKGVGRLEIKLETFGAVKAGQEDTASVGDVGDLSGAVTRQAVGREEALLTLLSEATIPDVSTVKQAVALNQKGSAKG